MNGINVRSFSNLDVLCIHTQDWTFCTPVRFSLHQKDMDLIQIGVGILMASVLGDISGTTNISQPARLDSEHSSSALLPRWQVGIS